MANYVLCERVVFTQKVVMGMVRGGGGDSSVARSSMARPFVLQALSCTAASVPLPSSPPGQLLHTLTASTHILPALSLPRETSLHKGFAPLCSLNSLAIYPLSCTITTFSLWNSLLQTVVNV